jgi:hypothetical protein
MKKLGIMLLACLVITGCTAVRIDTNDIDNMVSVILSKNNKLYNHVGKGYKYYVPRGVTYIDTNEFNEKLYSNGNYYYLYVDAISYYYKKDINYTINTDAYYSKKFDMGKKTAYLEINRSEKNNKYFIEFMYNYAKIETLVDKEDINDAVMNASYILSTVKFNANVIKLMLNENYFTNKEETYDVFTSKKTEADTDDFLEYSDKDNAKQENEKDE